jgi:hypothetical protein
MWGQIAQAIAKVYGENEETKRNAINKVSDAAKAGEGNNGADYSNLDAGSEGGEGGGIASVGSGYQKPSAQNTSGTSAVTNSASNLVSTGKDIASTFADKNKGATPAEGEKDEEEEEDTKNAVDMLGSSGGGMDFGSMSDERLKRIFGDNEDAIKAFSKIDSIKFEYNDKAKKLYPEGEKNVDSDPHYGVKAQDLQKNPYTASTVQEDPDTGYLNVNTQELTMANSAVISDICKRLLAIEKILGVKVV